MSKETITRAEYLQLIGALALAKRENDVLYRLCDMVGGIVGEDEPRSGHSADQVFAHEPDADELLRKLKIKVTE